MRKILAATAALAMMASSAANAVVNTISGSFTATNWSVYFGSPSPFIDPLFLSYSVTFDDFLPYNNDASVLTILNTNIPYAINFSFEPNGIMILATNGNSGSCTHTPNTFCAFINTATPNLPTFVEQSGQTGGWIAGTITPGTGAVPEPASWAMLITGFGLVGAAARRRRTAVAA